MKFPRVYKSYQFIHRDIQDNILHLDTLGNFVNSYYFTDDSYKIHEKGNNPSQCSTDFLKSFEIIIFCNHEVYLMIIILVQ